jgi:hypothetical protein
VSKANPVVAVFVLDGAVPLYADTLRYLAWKLAGCGARIVRFGCSGVLNACTSLNSIGKSGLAATGKATVCSRCIAAQSGVEAASVFGAVEGDVPASEEAVTFLEDLRRQMEAGATAEHFLGMVYRGIEVCRIAFFDFASVTKLSHTSVLDAPARERFLAGVVDLMTLLDALERLNAHEEIDHVLYVNGNYSPNTLVRAFFERRGVPCVSVEPQPTSQSTLSKVVLVKDRLVLEPDGLLRISSVASDGAPALGPTSRVLETFGARIDGGDFNAYTSLRQDPATTEELRRLNTFLEGFTRTRAFFLSSEDELTPHIQTHGALNGGDLQSPGGFPSQADFTRYLLEKAARYPDTGFVIRLHPRMAANKRDKFESEEHVKYKTLFETVAVPENVFVIYGDSKISSYYLISVVDLVIIAWSTIGLEAVLLGKPVVSAFPACLMYPLSEFSTQPVGMAAFEAALFTQTDCGIADDDLFLRWLSRAFEGQFFTTAALRNDTRAKGRFYRSCCRRLDRLGLYGLVARLVGLMPSAGVRYDRDLLLVAKSADFAWARVRAVLAKRRLARYREAHLRLLAKYGRSSR